MATFIENMQERMKIRSDVLQQMAATYTIGFSSTFTIYNYITNTF
jgi:hypothetical protein